MQAPRDVVNRVLDPVHRHVQIPAHLGRSGGVARDLVEKRACDRVVLEKHVEAFQGRQLLPFIRRAFFVHGIRWYDCDLGKKVQALISPKRGVVDMLLFIYFLFKRFLLEGGHSGRGGGVQERGGIGV